MEQNGLTATANPASAHRAREFGMPANHASSVPAVAIRELGKRFRGRIVIDAVSLSVAAGESVAIAGINGAGKTTLLRCLLDFMLPEAGSIEIFGIDSRTARARRALFYLPERFVPSPHLSGAETLKMLAGLHGLRYAPEQAVRALERLEFPADALRRPVRQYSKGMTQKIGLAAMLLADRPLMVLDEPMSGLDPIARRLVLDVLEEQRARGRTLLFTSHAPRDIERLCDRVAILHEGRLRYAGAPAALCIERAATDLEAAFIATIH